MKTGHVLGKQDSWSPYVISFFFYLISFA